MRIRELFENIAGDLESDLNDLLAIAKGNGLTEVETNKLVQQLMTMGYSVTPEVVVTLIQQNGQAADASLEKITLTSQASDEEGMDAESSAEKVEDMAIDSGMKGIRK